MPLFVQLRDKKKHASVWHRVESHEPIGDGGASSLDFDRLYHLGCGLTQQGPASQLAEADGPPWTHRHVAKGCFTTASDPQED